MFFVCMTPGPAACLDHLQEVHIESMEDEGLDNLMVSLLLLTTSEVGHLCIYSRAHTMRIEGMVVL